MSHTIFQPVWCVLILNEEIKVSAMRAIAVVAVHVASRTGDENREQFHIYASVNSAIHNHRLKTGEK